MEAALRMARISASKGEIPIGAVIVKNGRILSAAHNEKSNDPTAHAEIVAVRRACRVLGTWNLSGCTLYVTLEPCPMCAGAIVLARIPLVVWGMTDPLRGGAVSRFQILQSAELNHRCEVLAGVLEDECAALIKGFFKQRRLENKQGDETD